MGMRQCGKLKCHKALCFYHDSAIGLEKTPSGFVSILFTLMGKGIYIGPCYHWTSTVVTDVILCSLVMYFLYFLSRIWQNNCILK